MPVKPNKWKLVFRLLGRIVFEATDHLSLRVGDTESCCLPFKKMFLYNKECEKFVCRDWFEYSDLT